MALGDRAKRRLLVLREINKPFAAVDPGGDLLCADDEAIADLEALQAALKQAEADKAVLAEALDLWLRCHQDKLDADLGDRANNKLCPCFECKITREAIAKVKS